jgi:hypothetical protein
MKTSNLIAYVLINQPVNFKHSEIMRALKRLFCSECPVFLSIGSGSSWGIHGERSFDVLWSDIRDEQRGNRRAVQIPH